MNASRPALPEPSLAAWSRTARPVRLSSSIASRLPRLDFDVPARDIADTDQVDDLMFGFSAAALMAVPLVLAAATLVG